MTETSRALSLMREALTLLDGSQGGAGIAGCALQLAIDLLEAPTVGLDKIFSEPGLDAQS